VPYTDGPVAAKPADDALRSGLAPGQFPAEFGRYRLERLLGKGGMGAVYLAHDTQLDRPVALKVPGFAPDDAGLRERFFREARAAATLNHPNLCPVYDVGEHAGVPYLTMAFIDGKPLSDYVRPDKPLAPQQVAALVRLLARALQEAHDHGVVHRDLKPANVMIGRKNQPVIMDFGLARRAAAQDERLTRSGALMGTPAYMPPEQVNGDLAAMGPGCDIYALGVILYELLTGRRPFDGPVGVLMARIVTEPPPPPTQFRPDLDRALEAICLKALAKNPGDRYPTMRAFAAALDEWLAGKAPAPPPAKPPMPAPPPLPVATPVSTLTMPKRRPTIADDEEDPPAPPRSRRSAASKREKKVSAGLSSGKRWFLIVSAVVFFFCVLPGAGVAVVIYQAIREVSSGAARAGQWIEDMKKDQDKRREDETAERTQWEDLARTWVPPPAPPGPPGSAAISFPDPLGGFKLTEHDAQADVIELKLRGWPGWRAVYEGPDGKVELFVYRANDAEKKTILRDAQEALVKLGGPITPLAGMDLGVRGSADGVYLSYETGLRKGKPDQYGTFWGDRGWLFLARGRTAKEPGELLKAYIEAVGRKP
jgi:serine/threonine protein kinase